MNLYYKRFLFIPFIQGLIYAVIMTFMFRLINEWSWSKSLWAALINGCLLAVFYVIINARFPMATYEFKKIQASLQSNEEVQQEAVAHYTDEKNMVTGKLIVTNQRLIFMSKPFEKTKSNLSIPLLEIETCHIKSTLPFMKKELVVSIQNHTQHFVVRAANKWVKAIDLMKNNNLIQANAVG